jgi:uncharacterized OB-fold protein
MKHYTKAERKAKREKPVAAVVMSDEQAKNTAITGPVIDVLDKINKQRKTTKASPPATKSTGKTPKKQSDTKSHAKPMSVAASIKAGICPHDRTKLPALNEKHRSTCPKCGHVVYYLSARAIGCLTCRKERKAKKVIF